MLGREEAVTILCHPLRFVLDDLDDQMETITFESDAFSHYILCYKDTKTNGTDRPVSVPDDKPTALEIPKDTQRPLVDHLDNVKPAQEESQQQEEKPKKQENKKDEPSKDTSSQTAKSSGSISCFILIPIAIILLIIILLILKFRRKAEKNS